MSKDQKQNNKLKVENVDKLTMSCKMINEIRVGLKYWKFDQIWPTNLYYKTLEEVISMINQVIFNSQISNEPNSVSVSHIIDK